MANIKTKKGVIGILTGGGDVPGFKPGNPRRHIPRAARRLRGNRHPSRLGRPRGHGPRPQIATTVTTSST